MSTSVRPEYLTCYYSELAGQVPGMRMTLLRDDGRALARWPDSVSDKASAPDRRADPTFCRRRDS